MQGVPTGLYWLQTTAHKFFYLTSNLMYASGVSVEVLLLQVDLPLLYMQYEKWRVPSSVLSALEGTHPRIWHYY